MINFGSQDFKRYFSNTSWILVERVVRMLITLFTGIYVARYLGPKNFGSLSYALSFVGIFSIFSTLGLDMILVRNLVRKAAIREKILGTAFLLKLIGFIVMLFTVYIAARLASDDIHTINLILVVAFGILFQAFNVIDVYFESQVLAKLSSFAKFFSLICVSIFKIWFIFIQAPLLWFAWAFILENVLQAFFLVFFYSKKNLHIFSWKFERNIAFQILRDSWPLLLSSLAIMIYLRIDQIMINSILDSEAVGNYAVAVRISEAFYFIPMAVCSSLFPAIITAKKINTAVYLNNVQKLYDLMTWTAFAIALLVTSLADNLVAHLFGNSFLFAAGALKIHVWAGIFVFLGVASGKWLVIENLQKYSFFRTFVGMVVNVVFNLIFIPKFGIKGAAYATFLSYFAAGYLSMLFIRPIRRNFWMVTKSFNPVAAGRRIFNTFG